MPTQRLSTTMTTSAGSVVTNGQTFTEEASQSLSLAVPDAETNKQYIFMGLDVSKLVSYVISSDQDVIIYTNAAGTGAPDDTLNINANDALIWNTDSLYTSLLTTDITTNIFITNASGSTANIEMRFLYDSIFP